MNLTHRLGQALSFARKLGQGIHTARRIGSVVNKELGGALTRNKYGAAINDISRTAGDVVGKVTGGLEKVQSMENRIRRL